MGEGSYEPGSPVHTSTESAVYTMVPARDNTVLVPVIVKRRCYHRQGTTHSRDLSGRGAARAEDAQWTPTQSHLSPSILAYEDCLTVSHRSKTKLQRWPSVRRSQKGSSSQRHWLQDPALRTPRPNRFTRALPPRDSRDPLQAD